jgi:hypothetical protein
MYGYGNSFFLTTRAILAKSNAAVLPVNTVAPALSGTAQENQTLTCSTGTWTGTPTITFAYQWKRNGSNIGSATNSTYTLVTADVGQSILCTVTATNGAGSVNANSNTVTPTSAVDPDAQAFITAASITNPTQQSAINTLVVDLKGYNIWTKFKAIYPIVGGSSSAHAVNLKTPGTFNLAFATGWTHSSTGMTPNGNTYATTGININSVMSLNSMAFGVYSRTNSSGSTTAGAGAGASSQDSCFIVERWTDNVFYGQVNTTTNTSIAVTNSSGFYQASRTASNAVRLVRNTTHATSSAASTAKPNLFFLFGARSIDLTNATIQNSSRQIAFGYLSDGFTQTECDNLYTAVQAYQTTLSRQV